MSSDPAETFRQEARELLEQLEQGLLDLEQNPANDDLINSTFRALHTIKGSGAMFGFTAVAAFVHEFETAFDQVRKGHSPATSELIAVALDAKDHIHKLIEQPDAPQAGGEAILEALRVVLMAADGAVEAPVEIEPPKSAEQAAPVASARRWRIRFRLPGDAQGGARAEDGGTADAGFGHGDGGCSEIAETCGALGAQPKRLLDLLAEVGRRIGGGGRCAGAALLRLALHDDVDLEELRTQGFQRLALPEPLQPYAHGGFEAPATCPQWRRLLNAGDYDYVVTTRDRLEPGKPPYPETTRWTESPQATPMLKKPPTVVFAITGSLDPSACR